MTLPRPALTRTQVVLLALALTVTVTLVGGIRVADDHPLSSTPSQSPLPGNATPDRIFDRVDRHLEHSTFTVRMHTNETEATGMDTDSAPVRFVFRADAERNRLHAYMYHYDGNRTWTTSCSYVTDGASIARTGVVHSETAPGFCDTGETVWYGLDRRVGGETSAFGFTDWHGPPSLSDGWNVTSRNESTVVLRTTSFDAFAAMDGRPVDEDIEDGSYTVCVDANTGRLTRIERVIAYEDTGGEIRPEVTVYRFSAYGTTDVSPPDALGYPTLGELTHDVIVY